MIYLFVLLLLLFKISIEETSYDDFPRNAEFNIIKEDKKDNITNIYAGNILTYFKIKNNGTFIIENVNDYTFDFINMNYSTANSEIKQCSKCNKSEPGQEDCEKICIENFYISYGEYLYLRFIYIPFLFVLFGTFICLYGRTHFIFAMFFEFIWFIYFFVIDSIQLFNYFDNSVIPFYVFGAALISAFMLSIVGNLTTKHALLLVIFNIIKGCIIGFFFIKTFFYYISIFTPINNILYLVFLLFFIILGGVGEYFLNMKYKIEQILYIICSALSGSMLIARGLSYIIGGYFSDSLTSHHGIEYSSDAKLRVTFFLVLHLILIICSLVFQIIDYKHNTFEDSSTRKNALNSKNTDSSNKDINVTDGEIDTNAKGLKETTPEFASAKSSDNNLHENDDNEDINDQDD